MAYEFEDLQKIGKEQYDAAAAVTNSIAKALQAIATETADYSKKSLESGSAFMEQLLGAKSYDNAIQIQTEYWKHPTLALSLKRREWANFTRVWQRKRSSPSKAHLPRCTTEKSKALAATAPGSATMGVPVIDDALARRSACVVPWH
jgi:hypothetical protein